MKRKKGYTLIEIVIVMSIVLFLMSIFIKSYSTLNKISTESNIQGYLINIKNKWIYYKEYCIKNQVRVDIEITATGIIQIKDSDRRVIEEIYTNKNLKMVFGTRVGETNTISYSIDFLGKVREAGTIGFVDFKGNKYKITITPGDEVIRIYTANYNGGEVELK